MNTLKQYFIYYPLFWAGYVLYLVTKSTNWYSYISFRRLFFLTRGRFNDFLSTKIQKQSPPMILKTPAGLFSDYSEEEVNAVVDDINNNGYHIFRNTLDERTINNIIDFSYHIPSDPIPNPGIDGQVLFKRDDPIAPKYNFLETLLCQSEDIQKILSDISILNIAQLYLQCNPIQDLLAMWWSVPFASDENSVKSQAAQLYHFDMDRIKFIKFFFYLTDVDTSNGPHCYVKSSHKEVPQSLQRDGRFTDEEIIEEYSKENCVEITGEKGSIIAVDTRGFHKGKPLENKERLLLQIEYTNSLFGAPYNRIDLKDVITEETRDIMAQYPHTYQRFKL